MLLDQAVRAGSSSYQLEIKQGDGRTGEEEVMR